MVWARSAECHAVGHELLCEQKYTRVKYEAIFPKAWHKLGHATGQQYQANLLPNEKERNQGVAMPLTQLRKRRELRINKCLKPSLN